METQTAFLDLLQAHSVLAEPGDVQWLVTRAAKEERAASPTGVLLFKPKPAPVPDNANAYRASSESSKMMCSST